MSFAVFWDSQNIPLNHTFGAILDALRNEDMRHGLLTDAVNLNDIYSEADMPVVECDAVVVPFVKLEAKMRIMSRAMNRVAGGLSVIENGVQISQPFMRQGTANVVALFELSDGQTISIYFHNPDVTPKKITPQDDLISFKWLLNKKDITIVVAPERGKDLNINQVAIRVMKLAEKNSAAFQRLNAKRAEKTARLAELERVIAEKQAVLDAKLKELKALQDEKSERELNNGAAEQGPEQGIYSDSPISITGNEFGDFDISTNAGQKAFVKKVSAYLDTLKGSTVFNVSLNADIKLERNGIDKVLYFNGLNRSPVKMQAMAKITDILRQAKVFKTKESYEPKERTHKIIYHYLKTPFSVEVDGEVKAFRARVVVREKDGKFFYDLQVKDSRELMDSIKRPEWLPLTHSGLAQGVSDNDVTLTGNTTLITDDTQGGYVLNLFVEVQDENGNWVALEDEKSEWELAQKQETYPQPEPLDESKLEPLNMPENADSKVQRQAMENWLKQLKGKTITTMDNHTVHFSNKSNHLAYESAVKGLFPANAITKIIEVFKSGEFAFEEPLKHKRNDGFVAFRAYRKWVALDESKEIHLQVKAGKFADSTMQVQDITVYSAVKLDNAKEPTHAGSLVVDNAVENGYTQFANHHTDNLGASFSTAEKNHTPVLDDTQAENIPPLVVEILEVRELSEDKRVAKELRALKRGVKTITKDEVIKMAEAHGYYPSWKYDDDVEKDDWDDSKLDRRINLDDYGIDGYEQVELVDYPAGEALCYAEFMDGELVSARAYLDHQEVDKGYDFEAAFKAFIAFCQPEKSVGNNEPISVTGEEFENSSLDMKIQGNKAKLRQEVQNYLESMVGKDGIHIYNKALDEDVLLNNRGVGEMLHFSGDPRKLNLMKHIKQIIATAKPSDGKAQKLKNDKKTAKPHAKGYYHFVNEAEINGKPTRLFVFFEVDDNGVLHYDFMIPKQETAFDSTGNCTTITNRGIEPETKAVNEYSNLITDDAQGGYVLNLFLFDENGDEIDKAETEIALPEQKKKTFSFFDGINYLADSKKIVDRANLAEAYTGIQAIYVGETVKKLIALGVKNAGLPIATTQLVLINVKKGIEAYALDEAFVKTKKIRSYSHAVKQIKEHGTPISTMGIGNFIETTEEEAAKHVLKLLQLTLANAEKTPWVGNKIGSTSDRLQRDLIEIQNAITEKNEINPDEPDTDLSKYQQDGETLFEAAHNLFKDKLQGKIVKTQIGDVHLLGSTWQKMKGGIKQDELKAKLIPFVPQILKGHYDGKAELTKDRTDDFVRFHAFSKQIGIDEKLVLARVTVGERKDGEFVFTAYSLHKTENPAGLEVDSLRHTGNSVGCILSLSENLLLDDVIVNNDDGWNIEILSVTDLDGNPVSFEDDNTADPELIQNYHNIGFNRVADMLEANADIARLDIFPRLLRILNKMFMSGEFAKQFPKLLTFVSDYFSMTKDLGDITEDQVEIVRNALKKDLYDKLDLYEMSESRFLQKVIDQEIDLTQAENRLKLLEVAEKVEPLTFSNPEYIALLNNAADVFANVALKFTDR